jgi:hypothetical protein
MDALTCALAALLLAGAGVPGHRLPVAVQDDALLLNRSPAQVQHYTGQIAQEGACYVRLTAGQRDLPHDRAPAGRDWGAERRGPSPALAVRAPYRTVILPTMPGWIVQR